MQEHAATRRAALAVLRALLVRNARGADGAIPAAGAALDGAFAQDALARLAAPEVVQLVDWVEASGGGAPPWASVEVLHTAALAHVVTGFLQRRPSLIQVLAGYCSRRPCFAAPPGLGWSRDTPSLGRQA